MSDITPQSAISQLVPLPYGDNRYQWPQPPILKRIGSDGPPASMPYLADCAAVTPSRSPWQDRDGICRCIRHHAEQSGYAMPDEPLQALGRNASLIIAGQQPVLCMGPMYVFYKAVTAITLARRMSEHSGTTVLPAFWVASEDHDVQEVNHCTVAGAKCTTAFGHPLQRGRVPQVGTIPLAEHRDDILRVFDNALGNYPHAGWIMDMLGSCRFDTYSSLFAGLMQQVFEGYNLLLIDALAVRPQIGNVLGRLVQRWPDVQDAFAAGSQRVRQEGFDPPLDAPGLFEIVDGMRVACAFDNTHVHLSDGAYTFDRAAEVIRRHPERFSPNAALRPVVQDAILPVAATVAGPTEIVYLWQIDPLYEVAEVTRSLLKDRLNGTCIDPATRDTAVRCGVYPDRVLAVADMLRDYHPPHRHRRFSPRDRHIRQPWHETTSGTDLQQSGYTEVVHPQADAIQQSADVLLAQLQQVYEQTNAKWARKAYDSVQYQTTRVADRLREQTLAEQGRGRDALTRIAGVVCPDGKPQERVNSVWEYLARVGPALVEDCVNRLDPLCAAHYLIELTA